MGAESVHVPVRVHSESVTDEMLKKINRHTLEPVTADDIFTFSGICSNDRMDSYLTKMDPTTTLRNYAEDLKSGVALLPSHDIRKSPYGRSYEGEVLKVDEADGDLTQVRGHWYILNDTNINGDNTSDTIRAIKAGILKDMSVGFGGNTLWYRCSSCGRDLMNFDCPHLPGMEDEEGRISFGWVVEGHLREVSTVYKGATPGAFIEKAREYMSQGQLPQKHIPALERHYRVKLDDGKRSIFMPKKEGKTSMNFLDELREQIRENKLEKGKVYDILTDEGDPFRQPDDIALRNELGKDYSSVQSIRQLKKEAQQGRRYLADVIDEAVSARVKAQGDTFNPESYRTMLTNSGDIDAIKEEIESYERMAEQRFTSGRQTEEENPEDHKDEKEEHEEEVVRADNFKTNFFDDGSDK
ncbi:hypothetical protein [Halobacillus sp. H74]|uniref:hypothetical protein n=1 Tax=Halobacillus sp. H74 TaxID=3457436 RepID=UPI003FCC5FEC